MRELGMHEEAVALYKANFDILFEKVWAVARVAVVTSLLTPACNA
jgi:hypothetical protein